MATATTKRILAALVRLLFPTWKLFDQIGDQPWLEFRYQFVPIRMIPTSEVVLAEWTSRETLDAVPELHWWNLVYNPQMLRAHLMQNVLVRWMMEPQKKDGGALLQKWIEEKAIARGHRPQQIEMQVYVMRVSGEKEILLESTCRC